MCGFVGIYDHGRAEGGVDERLLERMRDVISHRGPDGAGTFVSEDLRVGLGHRRLAIVDLAHGEQPMFGEGGECLVFNGEIYNFPVLRQQLERDGVRFRTNCDTEVILHLYRRHGIDCVRHLNGMFAFALWDPAERRLLLARDPIGEKPLYWTARDGRLVFGSEIKAILADPSIPRAVNARAVAPYLTNLVASSPETLFEGIYKLPPGTIGVCDRDGLRVSPYWELPKPRTWEGITLDEAVPLVREQLDRSVEARLMSDVPLGVLLSGGLDSTTLVALMAEHGHEVNTFSVGFRDFPEVDERAEARRVAEHFGTEHHEVTVPERAALEFLPQLVHHQDEPLADPVCVPLHFVCELAHQNDVKVVLAGEGADELFWGYPSYGKILGQSTMLRSLLKLPGAARRAVPHLVPPSRKARLHEVLAGIGTGRPMPMHMPLGLTRWQRNQVLRHSDADLFSGWQPPAAGGATDSDDPIDRLGFDTQEYEFGLRLPELLLMRIDRFSMANSVEARVPFLDPDLVSLVYRMSPELKLAGGVSKVVLKRAVADVVPDWVINRKKQGFAAPDRSWLDAKMGGLLHDLLESDGLREHFDTPALQAAIAAGDDGRKSTPALWPVLNFALWHRVWVEQEPLDALIEPLAAGAVA